MNVEAQVTWTDGERFVDNARSVHGIVIDSQEHRCVPHGLNGARPCWMRRKGQLSVIGTPC